MKESITVKPKRKERHLLATDDWNNWWDIFIILLFIKHWHDKIASNKYTLKVAHLTGQFKSISKIEK